MTDAVSSAASGQPDRVVEDIMRAEHSFRRSYWMQHYGSHPPDTLVVVGEAVWGQLRGSAAHRDGWWRDVSRPGGLYGRTPVVQARVPADEWRLVLPVEVAPHDGGPVWARAVALCAESRVYAVEQFGECGQWPETLALAGPRVWDELVAAVKSGRRPGRLDPETGVLVVDVVVTAGIVMEQLQVVRADIADGELRLVALTEWRGSSTGGPQSSPAGEGAGGSVL